MNIFNNLKHHAYLCRINFIKFKKKLPYKFNLLFQRRYLEAFCVTLKPIYLFLVYQNHLYPEENIQYFFSLFFFALLINLANLYSFG